MLYRISDEVFDALPNAVFGAVAVRGIDNTVKLPQLKSLLDERIAECEQYFDGQKPKNTEDIIPYREAFRNLGINPSRYACSIEALMDRIAKGKGFPSINPAVDLGNAISIKYHIPIGAHDIDTLNESLDVRPATTDDTFVAFGQEEKEHPDEGEIVYVSGNEVRTRRWTWRQSEVGKITEETSSILFPIDGFKDFNQDKVEAAIDEFKQMIHEFWGEDVEIRTGIVDSSNRIFEF